MLTEFPALPKLRLFSIFPSRRKYVRQKRDKMVTRQLTEFPAMWCQNFLSPHNMSVRETDRKLVALNLFVNFH